MKDSCAVPLNMEVPATSSAAATFSEDPPMEYRDQDPTSVKVALRSEYAPLKLYVDIPTS